MHKDFRNNLIRFHLLKKATSEELEAANFTEYFEDKAIRNVSVTEIKEQLEHLKKEAFLTKETELAYRITKSGEAEIAEVKAALRKFID